MTTKAIATRQSDSPCVSPFSSENNFDLAIRMAKAIEQSDFLPQSFKGKQGNTMIALELANRLNMPVPLVLQNCNVIHGKPSFSAKTQIALVNQSGKFDKSLSFQFNEKKTECYAWTETGGERIEGPLVTLEMAAAEGWLGKNGSKWKSMPEIMLMYRAATFFVSLHAPELLMGIPSSEELYDAGPSVAKDQASLEEAIQASGGDALQSGTSLAYLAQGKQEPKQDKEKGTVDPARETPPEPEDPPQTGRVKFEGFDD